MDEIDIDGIKITRHYAALIDDVAIVADLHIGYEGVLQREGAMIPKYQKEILKERLNKIVEEYEPSLLIINGDFKHEFGKNLRQEWRETIEILEFLISKTKVILIRGNHDNFLRTIANKLNVRMMEHFEINEIKIFHGHKEMKGKKILMAHEHPSLHLRDKVGALVKLPCFITNGDITVLPALSPLAMGTDVSSASNNEYLSPILRNANIDDFDIYAISDELLYFSKIGKIKKVI